MLDRKNHKQEMKQNEVIIDNFTNLPKVLKCLVLNHLSAKELMKSLTTSKDFDICAKLTPEYKLLNEGRRILNKDKTCSTDLYVNLNTVYGLKALALGYISIEQAAAIRPETLSIILSANGLIILSRQWLTLVEIRVLDAVQLDIIFSDKMLEVFLHGFMTPKEAMQMTTPKLQIYTDDLTALKKKLIMPKHVNQLAPVQLRLLLSSNGLFALENHKMHALVASSMPVASLKRILETKNTPRSHRN